jgi:hypothetical protein
MPAVEGDAWPLLAAVLGTQASGVAPLVLELHSNPGRFHLTATPELETRSARFWSWAVTKLVGQRLHEAELPQMEGRCRLFQRDDGSMHLVRELRAGDAVRVFEADLVLREDADRTRLALVFPDKGVEADLDVEAGGQDGPRGARSRRARSRPAACQPPDRGRAPGAPCRGRLGTRRPRGRRPIAAAARHGSRPVGRARPPAPARRAPPRPLPRIPGVS